MVWEKSSFFRELKMILHFLIGGNASGCPLDLADDFTQPDGNVINPVSSHREANFSVQRVCRLFCSVEFTNGKILIAAHSASESFKSPA